MITPNFIYQRKEKFYRQAAGKGYSAENRMYEVSQKEFLAELDTSGHKIHDPLYYENIFKEIPIDPKDPNSTKKLVEIEIERISVPIQEVILYKHLTHLTGKDINLISHHIEPNEELIRAFVALKQGWLKKNMSTALYDFFKSIKATGDGAFCAILNDNKFSFKTFSILNGDEMHPIFDFNGNLKIFGRSFTSYDYEKDEDRVYLEVWDDKNYTLLAQDSKEKIGGVSWDKDFNVFNDDNVEGWELIKSSKHGFSSIPISYHKEKKGACWSPVQHLIDKLELALSQLFENNKAYAFRIMVIKGGVKIQGDIRGQARALLFNDKDGSANFMEKADASSSFELQLKETLKYILMGSFVVLPPEKLSGDIAGVAIKIMYSPAIEQAINDKNTYNVVVDKIVSLFKEGYSFEDDNSPSTFKKLDVRGDIQIYIPQNDAEVSQNLSLGVGSGYISRETASEQSVYTTPDELFRLDKETEKDIQKERDILTKDITDAKQ